MRFRTLAATPLLLLLASGCGAGDAPAAESAAPVTATVTVTVTAEPSVEESVDGGDNATICQTAYQEANLVAGVTVMGGRLDDFTARQLQTAAGTLADLGASATGDVAIAINDMAAAASTAQAGTVFDDYSLFDHFSTACANAG